MSTYSNGQTNSFTITGRIAKEPRRVQRNLVISRIAVSSGFNIRENKEYTDFYQVYFTDSVAAYILNEASIGQEITIEGKLGTRSIASETGKRPITAIILNAETVTLGEKSKKRQMQDFTGGISNNNDIED